MNMQHCNQFIICNCNNRLKNIIVLEDDDKKDKLIESHTKIGKSFKVDVQRREKELE